MPEGLIQSAAQASAPSQRRYYGVAVATVIDNLDSMGHGRVQLRLPWLPGVEPWARVAAFSAGRNRGAYFIPQIDDEVLVAFEHGDLLEPYVLGSLWNGQDSPPASGLTDPINKRIVKTPAGHVIELDDLQQSIKITSSTNQVVTIDSQKIEIATAGGTAKLKLDTSGAVELTAKVSLKLSAPSIKIEGQTIDVSADANLSLAGNASCKVQGGVVTIN